MVQWRQRALGALGGGAVVLIALSWFEQAMRWGDVVLGGLIGALAMFIVAALYIVVGGLRADGERSHVVSEYWNQMWRRDAEDRHVRAQARHLVRVEEAAQQIRDQR